MNDCTDYQRLILYVQSGEIREDELLSLHGHCRSCSDCASLLAAHEQLDRLSDTTPELTPEDSARLRGALRSRLHPVRPPSAWEDLRAFVNRHPGVLLPLAAAALVAVFALGRWSVSDAPGGGGDQLLTQLNRQAMTRQSLTDYLNNPLTYSNVSAKRRGNRLALSFDVQRHIELETGMDSPLARDVLLASLLDDASIGAKLRTIQLAPALGDPNLREALIFTLENDPQLAVRLEAAKALARYPDTPAVHDALLRTLDTDPAVQMRLVALDLLIQRGVDPAIIRQTILNTEREGDAAVMQQALQRQRSQS